MNDQLRHMSDHDLHAALGKARAEAANAMEMPLEPGFITQDDRDFLHGRWIRDVAVYEAEQRRRGSRGRSQLRAGGLAVLAWVALMVIGGFTVGGAAVAVLFYGGSAIALLMALAVWVMGKVGRM